MRLSWDLMMVFEYRLKLGGSEKGTQQEDTLESTGVICTKSHRKGTAPV